MAEKEKEQEVKVKPAAPPVKVVFSEKIEKEQMPIKKTAE